MGVLCRMWHWAAPYYVILEVNVTLHMGVLCRMWQWAAPYYVILSCECNPTYGNVVSDAVMGRSVLCYFKYVTLHMGVLCRMR